MNLAIKRLLFPTIVLILASFPVKAQESSINYLYPEDFYHSFRSEHYALIVDTRKANHFRKERINGAVNVKNMKSLVAFADTLDREIPIYLYCDGVSRSLTVADYLVGKGFVKIIILSGGIREWKERMMDMESVRQKRRPGPYPV